MAKAVIIGAGKTGRGFLARLIVEAPGYDGIVFIDNNEQLVRNLNAAGAFEVRFFGGVRTSVVVEGFRAYTWWDEGLPEALVDCEAAFVSVGGQNLRDVGAQLAPLLEGSAIKVIVTAENASHPAAQLRDLLGDVLPVAEGTVFCTTIEDEGLHIASEDYPYFQCDAAALGAYVPPCEKICPVAAFGNFLTRKLYTYNAASCVIAYLGYVRGYKDYADAANDPEICSLLDKNYEATGRSLCREFNYDPDDQREFALLSRRKFCDRTIRDTVLRNGRDPQRKLAPGERIMGPLRLQMKYGEDSSVLLQTVAAALCFREGGESAWDLICREKMPEQILTDICGLTPDETAYGAVLSMYRSLL